MNSSPQHPVKLILLVVGLTSLITAIALIFTSYMLAAMSSMMSSAEMPHIEEMIDLSEQQMTEPKSEPVGEPEMKDDSDLEEALSNLDTTDLDALDALLEENDLDAVGF